MTHKQASAVRVRRAEDGFTLLEAILAIGLMTLLLAILSTVTGQWMRSWKAGLDNTQSADLLALGLDRIVADIGAAEFISPGQGDKRPLFQGTDSSLVFVRSAIGPNSKAGLEIVRLAEIDDARGRIVVRSRAEFTPSVTADAIASGAVEFMNPVVLIRPPFHVSFAFAGSDRLWRETWLNAAQLPEAVRVSVRDVQSGEILPVSTAALINVTAPAECAANTSQACGGTQPGNAPPGANAGAPSGTGTGAMDSAFGGANSPDSR
jgi:general secretion pathway protein J